ncbi:HdeD family acid-resistance protein [Nostoc sp.]|uniref:HdeD family acid-resistance protein n=1 Tax=Nostoc sp. TaxID=1180 RepID=UPI002FF79CC2
MRVIEPKIDEQVVSSDFSRYLENLSLNLSPCRRETLNFPPSRFGKGARGLGQSLAFPHDLNCQVVSSGWTTAIPLVAVGIAILMIVLGIIAIAFPFFASVASTLMFGWIFIFAGITQIVYAFQSRGTGR